MTQEVNATVKKEVHKLSKQLQKQYDKTALQQLRRLCKQHNIQLQDYYTRKSRRSVIIAALHENVFCVETLAEMLSVVHSYNDIAQNKKAIAGTIYDMRTNAQLDIVIDNDTQRICVLKK